MLAILLRDYEHPSHWLRMARREKTSVEFIYCACGCGKTRPKYNKDRSEGRFIKGHTWKNKTCSEYVKLKTSEAHKGKILSEEHKRKLSKSNKNNKHHWKGDKVSYIGLHRWMRIHLPKPKDGKCMLCHQSPFKEAANITSIYNREPQNWAWFCIKCHRRWDNVTVRCWIKRRN